MNSQKLADKISDPLDSQNGSDQLDGLAVAWDAATKADLLRGLDRGDASAQRNESRFHAVEDAVASRNVGKQIDTSSAGSEDAMQVKVDSPDSTTTTTTTNNNYHGTPAWVLVAIATIILAGTGWLAGLNTGGNAPPSPVPVPSPVNPNPAPTPTPVPAPIPAGDIHISVIHAQPQG